MDSDKLYEEIQKLVEEFVRTRMDDLLKKGCLSSLVSDIPPSRRAKAQAEMEAWETLDNISIQLKEEI